MKYKLIFFDADETLFDYKKCEKYAFYLAIQNTGIHEKNLLNRLYHCYQEINAKLWAKYHERKITKDELLKNRYKILFDKFRLKVELDTFNNLYLDHLSKQVFLMPNVKETLSTLYKYCKLAIITNGVSEVHKTRLQRSEIKPYISGLIVSDTINNHIAKPHPAIFKYAHISMDKSVAYEDILMVGDNLKSDIQGGNNYGIATCWYNPTQKVNNTNIIPKYIINNFKNLISIIDYDKN